jgi:hypothetical protein
VTGVQLALDCDPTWTDGQPDDHTPTPFDLRQAELRDLRNQHAGPTALRTANTVPTGNYL